MTTEMKAKLGRASEDPKGRIVRAARNLFFSEGFDKVSVERLAKAANVSKSTLYKYFGDMRGVLKAVVEAEADQFSFEPEGPLDTAQALRDHLTGLGAALLTLIDKPEKIQFDQLIHEQARSHPKLAEVYFETIYLPMQHLLTGHIERGQVFGLFRANADPEVLADQLLSMWLGLGRIRTLLNASPGDVISPDVRSREAVETLSATWA
ncbi:MAG: TetR/AcrR family transcriptional regulator [Pseudomonadota bacterium]